MGFLLFFIGVLVVTAGIGWLVDRRGTRTPGRSGAAAGWYGSTDYGSYSGGDGGSHGGGYCGDGGFGGGGDGGGGGCDGGGC